MLPAVVGRGNVAASVVNGVLFVLVADFTSSNGGLTVDCRDRSRASPTGPVPGGLIPMRPLPYEGVSSGSPA
jgi:hypothetical protein